MQLQVMNSLEWARETALFVFTFTVLFTPSLHFISSSMTPIDHYSLGQLSSLTSTTDPTSNFPYLSLLLGRGSCSNIHFASGCRIGRVVFPSIPFENLFRVKSRVYKG